MSIHLTLDLPHRTDPPLLPERVSLNAVAFEDSSIHPHRLPPLFIPDPSLTFDSGFRASARLVLESALLVLQSVYLNDPLQSHNIAIPRNAQNIPFYQLIDDLDPMEQRSVVNYLERCLSNSPDTDSNRTTAIYQAVELLAAGCQNERNRANMLRVVQDITVSQTIRNDPELESPEQIRRIDSVLESPRLQTLQTQVSGISRSIRAFNSPNVLDLPSIGLGISHLIGSRSFQQELLQNSLRRLIGLHNDMSETKASPTDLDDQYQQLFDQLLKVLNENQRKQLASFLQCSFRFITSRSHSAQLMDILQMICNNKRFRDVAINCIMEGVSSCLDRQLFFFHELVFALKFEKSREQIEEFRLVAIEKGTCKLIEECVHELVENSLVSGGEEIETVLCLQTGLADPLGIHLLQAIPLHEDSSGLTPAIYDQVFAKIQRTSEETLMGYCDEWLDRMRELYPEAAEQIHEEFIEILENARQYYTLTSIEERNQFLLQNERIAQILKEQPNYQKAAKKIQENRNEAIAKLYNIQKGNP